MTGAQVKRLRERVGLEPGVFALLLGVHPSTVYRWESHNRKQIRMEPLQRQLCTTLEQVATPRLGQEIEHEIDLGGTLAGIYRLLQETRE